MRRKTLFYLFILSSGILALLLGFAETLNKVSAVCAEYSCVKVQTSSFNRLSGIPIPFIATFMLAVVAALAPRRKGLSIFILSLLVGAEAYMILIQSIFIKAYCKLCITFFILVSMALAFILERKDMVNAGKTVAFGFLMAHFIMFYPSISHLPWKTTPLKVNRSITIYSSPSCIHCRKAKKAMENISEDLGIPVFERPVPLTEMDRKTIRKMILKVRTPLLERLIDAYMWENEEDLIKLTGRLALPTIVLKDDGRIRVIVGWTSGSRTKVESFFWKKQTPRGLELPWEEKGKICTEEGPCE